MKKSAAGRHRQKNINTPKIFIIAILFLFILLFVSKSSGQKNILQVLGTTASNLLADKGSGDSGGSSGGGDSGGHDSGSSGSSGGGGSSGGSGSSGGGSSSGGDHSGDSGSSGERSGGSDSRSGGSSGGSSAGTVNDNTTVSCTGPDGKQFQTDFRHCAELNNGWHTPVNFTVVSTPIPHKETPRITPKTEIEIEHSPEPSHTPKPTVAEKAGKKGENETIEFKVKNGHNTADIKHEDETEKELETNDALEKANEALKETEVEVHASASGFVLRKGEVEAETHLPISVNPVTHELTVTTKTGAKTVTTLPDDAVKNLLNNGVLSQVQSRSTVVKGKRTTSQTVQLTELNSEPAFEVQGEVHKKFLGVASIIFSKTAFVSARTGAVLRIDETILDRIFELFSF